MALDNIPVTANTRTFLAWLKKKIVSNLLPKLSTRDHHISKHSITLVSHK